MRDLSHTSGIYSLLDVLLQLLNHYQEVGYSAPFAAQTPVVWWPFSSTFIVMLLSVFAVNVLADSVQHALNPRAPS